MNYENNLSLLALVGTSHGHILKTHMNEHTLLDNVMQEAHEKEWREKEHAEAEKIRRMNEELMFAREQQKIMKARQMANQVPLYTPSWIHPRNHPSTIC